MPLLLKVVARTRSDTSVQLVFIKLTVENTSLVLLHNSSYLMLTKCRFVDHQCHDLHRDDDTIIETDVDKALNVETAGKKRLWGMYLCGW